MTKTAERIASTLDARTRDKQADIEARYRRLVDQMARNEAIDEEAVTITIETLGRTSAQVRADVDRQLARIRASESAFTYAAKIEAMLTARLNCEEHLAETQRIVDARKQADKQAIANRDLAQSEFVGVNSTVSRLGEDDTPQLRARSSHAIGEIDPIIRRRIMAQKQLAEAETALALAADGIAKKRIATRQQLEAAEQDLALAKSSGLKKAELSEQADAVDAARSALAAVDADLEAVLSEPYRAVDAAREALAAVDAELADWTAQWEAILAERLTLPPATPQPPAPIHHPYGPGFPVR